MRLAGLHILLAEDNLTNQMVATQMLESLGAAVTLASDGQEAMELMESEVFDVALIDIEMPRISGDDVIRSLRSRGGRFRDMPMIALTAYVMREHRAAIDDAGADGIISKPILSIEQLGEDVLRILNGPRNSAAGTAGDDRADAAPAEPEADGVVDQAVFRDLVSAFDEDRRTELMRRISRDIGVACGRIRGAQVTADAAIMREASHVLISVAGTIGALRLQSLAQCLNSAGQKGDGREMDRIAPDLIAEATRVLDFIDRM